MKHFIHILLHYILEHLHNITLWTHIKIYTFNIMCACVYMCVYVRVCVLWVSSWLLITDITALLWKECNVYYLSLRRINDCIIGMITCNNYIMLLHLQFIWNVCFVCVRMYVCMYVCVYSYIRMYIWLYVAMYVYVCICA